jgi:hypothetical protein
MPSPRRIWFKIQGAVDGIANLSPHVETIDIHIETVILICADVNVKPNSSVDVGLLSSVRMLGKDQKDMVLLRRACQNGASPAASWEDICKQ